MNVKSIYFSIILFNSVNRRSAKKPPVNGGFLSNKIN